METTGSSAKPFGAGAKPSSDELAIVFIVPGLGLGGVGNVVAETALLTSRAVASPVDIIALESQPVLKELHSGSNVRVFLTGSRRLLRSSIKIAQFLFRGRYGLIISCTPHVNVLTVAFRTFLSPRSRLVIWDHGVLPEKSEPAWGHRTAVLIPLMKAVYRLSDQLLAVSSDVVRDLESRGIVLPENVSVISTFVDPPAAPLPQEISLPSKFILGVGRLSWEKGFDRLLNAFPLIKTEDLQLVIAGGGEEESRLRLLAKELSVEDRVVFLGHVDNTRVLMRRSEVVVFPSRREGAPIALLEALQEGARIVVSDCPGSMQEIIGCGKFGTVSRGTSPPELAESIDACLSRKLPSTSQIIQRGLQFTAGEVFPAFLDKVILDGGKPTL